MFIKNCDSGRIITLNMEQGRVSFIHLKEKNPIGADGEAAGEW